MSDNIKAFESPYGTFRLRRPTIQDHVDARIEAYDLAQGKAEQLLDWLTTAMAEITVAARRPNQKNETTPSGFPADFSWDDAYDFQWVADMHKEFTTWWQSFRQQSGADATPAASTAGVPD